MILVNGENANQLSALDRGLHYGDGLFETIAMKNGRPCFWERHMDRLRWGCERLKFPAPDESLLFDESIKVAGGQLQAVLKIIITRGQGERGFRFPKQQDSTKVTRVVMRLPATSYPEEYHNDGITVRLCETRLSSNVILAGVKHLNRLEQVMARSEWDAPDIVEGLMLNEAGHLIEGTMSNIFIAKDGCLNTPDLSSSGVSGVMRGVIIDMADRLDIPLKISTLDLEDIRDADEVFITNSLIGVWAVRHFQEINFPYGTITTRIRNELGKYTLDVPF
ncbi:MAG: aminodeoxychorismate lyase [Gammaproteobacteria bacterium]